MLIIGGVKDIIDSRNILKSLVVRNLVGRYKNSLLGFAWDFVTPAIMMFVYYVVFTQIRSSDIPDFWIFVSSALFPFNFMISNLTVGSGCIVSNASMIKKIYFPREIIVLSQVISSLVILIIGYAIVFFAIVVSGHNLDWVVLFFPIVLFLMFMFTVGFTLLFSSITVYIRDVQYLLSSLSMVFFFMTPMYA